MNPVCCRTPGASVESYDWNGSTKETDMQFIMKLSRRALEIDEVVRDIVDAEGITTADALREALEAMQFYDALSKGKSPYPAIGPYAITKNGVPIFITPMASATEEALRVSRSKLGSMGAQGRKKGFSAMKAYVLAEYETNACKVRADGSYAYKNKKAFLKTMQGRLLAEFKVDIKEANTIANWIKESSAAPPPIWVRRAGKKKI